MPTHPKSLRPLAARAVYFGFATSLTVWVVAYALHMLDLPRASVGIFFTLTLIQFGGAKLAGRSAGPCKPWRTGLAAGLVTGLINLLALGSILADHPDQGGQSFHPVLAVIGYLVFSGAVGLIAGRIGGLMRTQPTPAQTNPNWLGRFAVLTTVAAFVLLIVGGVVTSSGSGLAVPDWPQSFGANMFLFPLSKMTGGVFLEHAHRLLGALVGLTTAALLVWTILTRVLTITKLMAAASAGLVIVQAILGGIRVTDQSTALAFVHGVTGQIYVASLALLAVMLSTTWRSDRKPTPSPHARSQRLLNLVALLALVVQITLGAAVRHFDLQMHALISHMSWSVVTMILLLTASIRAQKNLGADEPILRRAATATKHTVLLQMGLGVVAVIAAMMFHEKQPPPTIYIALRTPHQVVGALLLILTTLLTAWTIRLTRASDPAEST